MVSDTWLGKEFTEAWRFLKEQAADTVQFLEEEVPGPLMIEVYGVGDGRTNEVMRAKLWKYQDQQTHKALERAIEEKDRRIFCPSMVLPEGQAFISLVVVYVCPQDKTIQP